MESSHDPHEHEPPSSQAPVEPGYPMHSEAHHGGGRIPGSHGDPVGRDRAAAVALHTHGGGHAAAPGPASALDGG